MFITEFNTKILEAFVKERKVSFSADGHVPCEECLYKLYIEKTVQNKFVKEITFQKIGLWM